MEQTINMNTQFATLVSLLFASRTQAHIFHLQTSSYAAHKALNGYYDDIVDLTDGLIESYQGKYGIVSDYIGAVTVINKATQTEVNKYFTDLLSMVETIRKEIPQDSYIQNQTDAIVELITGTLYKLKYLQ